MEAVMVKNTTFSCTIMRGGTGKGIIAAFPVILNPAPSQSMHDLNW
jgi:hypothetical protein